MSLDTHLFFCAPMRFQVQRFISLKKIVRLCAAYKNIKHFDFGTVYTRGTTIEGGGGAIPSIYNSAVNYRKKNSLKRQIQIERVQLANGTRTAVCPDSMYYFTQQNNSPPPLKNYPGVAYMFLSRI